MLTLVEYSCEKTLLKLAGHYGFPAPGNDRKKWMLEMSVADLPRFDAMLAGCRDLDRSSTEWWLLMKVTLSSLGRMIVEGVLSLDSRWEEMKSLLGENEEDTRSMIAWWQLQYPWRDGASGLSRLMWEAFPPVVCPGAFGSLMRCANPQMRERISQRFQFMGEWADQDWEIMMATESMDELDELLRGYEDGSLHDDEREVLMFIIMESIRDMEGGEPHLWQPRWEKVVGLLRQDIPRYAAFIGYWMCLDVEPDDRFQVSKHLIRAFPGYLGVAREGA
jgi:hypothetical protein